MLNLPEKLSANPIEKDRLMEFVHEMGLLASPQGAIDYYQRTYPVFKSTLVSDEDVLGISYVGKHFQIHPRQKDRMEIWIGNTYVNPDNYFYVDVVPDRMSYCIFKKYYGDIDECRVHYNPNTLYRYHRVESDHNQHKFTYIFDTNELPYSTIDIRNSCFYISQNTVRMPHIESIGNNQYRINVSYYDDIDFFICSNLARVVECHMWKREYITSPTDKTLYCAIVVNNRWQECVDARFYPAVLANGILRAYKDGCREYFNPYGSYLINYPEIRKIWDPYHPDFTDYPEYQEIDPAVLNFVRNYRGANRLDNITTSDSTEEIYDKISRIVEGCYNVCEFLPPNHEPSHFLIFDNTNQLNPTFIEQDGFIVSTIPANVRREILLYGTALYHGTYDLIEINNKSYYKLPITDGIDINQFTLIKFNTAEDTHLENYASWFNADNFLQLYYKINRFYKNLLFIRHDIMDDRDPGDKAWVGTTKPPKIDDHLWFEYIINTNPEEFETKAIEFHLNRDVIPEPIKQGAYSFDIPTDGGEIRYDQIMQTFYQLTQYYKHYLILHNDSDTENNPNTPLVESILLGDTKTDPDIIPREDQPNELLLDSPSFSGTTGRRNFYFNDDDDVPIIPSAIENDLYIKTKCLNCGIDVPNKTIEEIEFGDWEPTENINHKLWIDPHTQSSKPPKDYLDSVSDQFVVGDTLDCVNDPDIGAYGIDGLERVITEEIDPSFHDGAYDITSPVIDATYNLLDSVLHAIQEGTTIDEIEHPSQGMFALDVIESAQTTKEKQNIINKIDINQSVDREIELMPRSIKEHVITKYVTDDEAPKDANENTWWFKYVSEVDDWELNTLVKKLYITKSIFDVINDKGTLAIEGDNLPTPPEVPPEILFGTDEFTARDPGSLLFKELRTKPDGTVIPVDDPTRRKLLRYFVSMREPTDIITCGDLWVKIPPIQFDDFIKDILAETIIECGSEIPEEIYPGWVESEDGTTYRTTAMLDYGVHGGSDEVETLQGAETELRPIINDSNQPDIESVEDHSIWYEWLDRVAPAVCYSKMDTLVMRMDDHLYGVEFAENETPYVFAFDDIVMHFHDHARGTKYLAILADLMEAGIVTNNDIIFLYSRLITCRDYLSPQLHRVFARESNVVANVRMEDSDASIVYSTNIGRFTIDYREATPLEQAYAYKHCINLRDRDFAFLRDRMLLFVNGQYIHPDRITEPSAYLIQISDFHEIIACVDIFYYKRDQHIIRIKKLASAHWPFVDVSKFQDPKELSEMEFIMLDQTNYKGYYDILYRDYIENGYLVQRMMEVQNDPVLLEEFKRELIEKFQDITDKKLFQFTETNRIVLFGGTNDKAFYEIN